MAALPPALTAYVLARQCGTCIDQAPSVMLFGTLTSVLTWIIVMWLVQTRSLTQLAVG